MKKKQLLYVMQHEENPDEGLSYAIYLAQSMEIGITILLVYKKRLMQKFEDAMTAVTFAEANEPETARAIIKAGEKDEETLLDPKISLLVDKCKTLGVRVDIYGATMDAMAALRNFLKEKAHIDMVLLSPGVSTGGKVTARLLDRFVKTVFRPIVTMTKGTTRSLRAPVSQR